MKSIALIFMAITFQVFAQGFTDSNNKVDSGQKHEALIGKTFTLMPNPEANPRLQCGRHLGFEFLEKPTIRTVSIYQSPAPIEYTVDAIVASPDPHSGSARYLKIIIKDNNKTTAYIRDFKFYATKPDGKVATILRSCNFEGNSEMVISEVEKAKGAKQISLGMNASNVEYETEWGSPDKVNILKTANLLQTQWVYDKFWKKGFLYFNETGILTAIQE